MNGKINVKVVLHKEGKGYWVEVPSLPGCYSQGESKNDALKNIKEALLLHLESLGTYKKAPASAGKSQVATVSLSA
ncbi:MAG: type II toxin-antitoxin system HicB family antitoxin [Candidatus Micrarchaeota archaeon]|nr:type II toxin-antitoxin system HicB family antitoxin [Candidatus Micrarchaeota archaeon]